MPIIYGSVCSGIEAATKAWHPLGMHPVWFAEIEPFPSAVLAHHYPDVPNHGDMTKLAALVLAGKIPAPDVLVGGTPCQAFSVAGMREGLTDPRGALTIKYVELADAVDYVRAGQRKPASVIVWENVPGVLSDKGNAFGCFLGTLAGEDCELQPSGKKWQDAGCVYGPKRTIAWRILDAQYFGLAQRRRRVFVVASARDGFDPIEVLFEREGVRRDTAPRRNERKDAAACLTASLGHCGGMPDCGVTPGGRLAYGGGNTSGPIDSAACLTAKGMRIDFEVETFVVHGTQDPCVSDMAFALGRNSGQENAVIAYTCKDYGADAGELSPTLRAMNYLDSHANAGGQVAIAYPIQNATRGKSQNGTGTGEVADPMYTLDQGSQHAVCITGEITHTLKAEGFDGSEDGTGRGQPIVTAYSTKLHHTSVNGAGKLYEEYTASLDASSPQPTLLIPSQVRRLTPRECERLQGFPDNYTLIPWRGKPTRDCPDGPRYKAIGNSKAVTVVRWIGRRLLRQITPSPCE